MLLNETYFVWWNDSQYGPRATIIGNKKPEKVNEITQAFWACIKTVGINRMAIITPPPEIITEPQAVWWLERYRVTYKQMQEIIEGRNGRGFVHTPDAREIATKGLSATQEYGQKVKQVLQDLNPQNEALKTPLISSDLSICEQLTAVAKLKEELGV